MKDPPLLRSQTDKLNFGSPTDFTTPWLEFAPGKTPDGLANSANFASPWGIEISTKGIWNLPETKE